MNKDELLELIDQEISEATPDIEYPIVLCRKITIKRFECLKEIRSIIIQHFSISKKEREEVIKWTHKGLEHEMRRDEPCEDTVGIFKIILKALGGKND